MFRTVDRDEAHARLRAAGYLRLDDVNPRHERWVNKHGFGVVLIPEHFGDYNEVAIEQLEARSDERP